MVPRNKRWILAIADDLTGALEVGAKFADRALTTRVTTECSITEHPDVTVLVIDTETRHLGADAAAAMVREVATDALQFAPWLIYKKTDSTLRGNIAAEFGALLEVFPERPLVFAPAYPQMGRTVRGGRLFVEGVPLHESVFARDPLNPIRESRISALLGTAPVVVLDGESTADIIAAARTIVAESTPPLAAGPAALAGALAEYLSSEENIHTWPRLSRCLLVNGSLHPTSAAQVAFAQTHGCFGDGWVCFDHHVAGSGTERALRAGESVGRLMESSPFDGLIIFGGDTAFGIHQAFGAPPFDPYGEVVPGVPLSRCGGLFWITKAGGFGAPDIVCDIRRRLT